MDSNVKACAECTQSCMSLHRAKLDPNPIVCSFFKVMFGKQFSEQLIVPPKFARTLNSLVGKKTYLEDTTGQKWDAKLSRVKGSLVIQCGWQDFSQDHGIELGDFVVFHHVRRSHFVVQIFTRSGCERPALFSDKNYQNKRVKATRDYVSDSHKVAGFDSDCNQREDNASKSLVIAEDLPIEGSTRKRHKVAPADEFILEPYEMTGGNTSLIRADDRDHLYDLSIFEKPLKEVVVTNEPDNREYLFDLSVFETPAKKEHTDGASIAVNHRFTQGFNESENAQIVIDSVDVEERQIAETNPLLASNDTCLSREEPNLLLKSSLDVDKPSDSDTLQGFARLIASRFPAAQPKFQPPGPIARTVKKEPQPCQNVNDYWVAYSSRNAPRDVLKDPATHNKGLSNLGDKRAINQDFLGKILKPESVDFINSTPTDMTKFTCSVVEQDGEPVLELPQHLPIKTCINQKLIVLHDSAGNKWPMKFEEKEGKKILAKGWKEFRKYHKVQPGNKCTFVLENSKQCIFKVEVLPS